MAVFKKYKINFAVNNRDRNKFNIYKKQRKTGRKKGN